MPQFIPAVFENNHLSWNNLHVPIPRTIPKFMEQFWPRPEKGFVEVAALVTTINKTMILIFNELTSVYKQNIR